jgi:hypothetical protein
MGFNIWPDPGSRKVAPHSDESKPYIWVFLILVSTSAAFVAFGGTTDREAIASSVASLAVPDTERAPPVIAARPASAATAPSPATPVVTVPARPAPNVSESGSGSRPAVAETGTVREIASAQEPSSEPELGATKKLRKRSGEVRPKRTRKAPVSFAENGIRGRLASSATLRDDAASRRTRSTIDLF